jgi:hypothetical protein
MTSCSKTAIVYNTPSKILGLPPYYYRYRNCNTNLTGNTPAEQYQRLKLIQNTVRVHGSLYTANLGPLSAYKKPITNPSAGFYGVAWNQMSDRPVPSVQKATIPTGYNTSLNRRRTSVTSSRPGCQTPGGIGVDIKHNSYDRYLNRLKGKGPMRRGVIPPDFGAPIKYNCAFPIYGGKTIKTNIVNDCNCPIVPEENYYQDIQIYEDPLWQPLPDADCSFQVGQEVFAVKTGTNFYRKATVIEINGEIYTVQFEDDSEQDVPFHELKYFTCQCDNVNTENYSVNNLINSSGGTETCYLVI